MAVLSRFPIKHDSVQDFSGLLWQDLSDALMPVAEGAAFPSDEAHQVLRLSSVAHWVVPVALPESELKLLAFHATPPVFDGPEDFNGRRNHDQLVFWQHYLNGVFGTAPDSGFVLIGDANLDPVDGDGHISAIQGLLNHPGLQDPKPKRPGPVQHDSSQSGDPWLDTVAWPTPDPGERRVDYVLPSLDLKVVASGVYWPTGGMAGAEDARIASRHKLVWVDLMID